MIQILQIKTKIENQNVLLPLSHTAWKLCYKWAIVTQGCWVLQSNHKVNHMDIYIVVRAVSPTTVIDILVQESKTMVALRHRHTLLTYFMSQVVVRVVSDWIVDLRVTVKTELIAMTSQENAVVRRAGLDQPVLNHQVPIPPPPCCSAVNCYNCYIVIVNFVIPGLGSARVPRFSEQTGNLCIELFTYYITAQPFHLVEPVTRFQLIY